MELGRSAPMLMSASPGRAAAMVPAPVERSQLRGHRQRSPNCNTDSGWLALTCLILVSRARGGGGPMPMMALAARCELRGGARQQSRFNNCGEGGPRSPLSLTTRAREALMMAGAGGATRAMGWRATATRVTTTAMGGLLMASPLSGARARGQRSHSNERLRVSNWIVQQLYYYAVK